MRSHPVCVYLSIILFLNNSGCISLVSLIKNVPVQDTINNNCISLKLVNPSAPSNENYSGIIFLNAENIEFTAVPVKPFSDDGLYYAFNIPPGKYTIRYAFKTWSDKDKTFHNRINFDNALISKSSVTVNINEFKFIGTFLIETVVPEFSAETFQKSLLNEISNSLRTQKNYLENTHLVLYENKGASKKAVYSILINDFKDTFWQPLIINEFKD